MQPNPMNQPMAPMAPMAPAYGAPPPAYYPPPPAANTGPTVISIGGGDSSGSPCPVCQKETGVIPRKKLGCVNFAWCIILFLTTGWLWCIPICCGEGCKDTEILCIKCQTVKQTVPGNFC